ncbi:MAG: lysophospholipid acyltransferase family protein [Verrucomicrobia bacterium]|nr:lysophospholipid acyltransferase family protein [Verrucomicrobiota bacterium]
MARPTDLPIGWKARVIAAVGVTIIRAFGCTIHFKLHHKSPLLAQEETNYIWAVWHNCLFSFPIIYRKFFASRKGAALTSASKDGEIAAAVVKQLGIAPIRGSNSRRGGQALIELTTWLNEGYDIALTPDGPRGPRYQLSPGLILLAKKTGTPIMPVAIHYHSCWKLNSWDQFRIPKPFSRIDVHVGPVVRVPPDINAKQFEEFRLGVQELMCAEGCHD